MNDKKYNNFVRASAEPSELVHDKLSSNISGEEAKRLYLEEIKDAGSSSCADTSGTFVLTKRNKVKHELIFTNKELFMCVQNNEVIKVKYLLDKYPEKINILDDYGWSLLMIACQAGSVDTTKVLLERGINIFIRDKAGNSAYSLVIKNKNYVLADILLKYKKSEDQLSQCNEVDKLQVTEKYMCDICEKTFPDRDEHLSSTIHNISASKGKKTPANYVIPASNKGYQLMLKGGWDMYSGLGRDGSGKKYPIKTIQKKDRKGLGHIKTKHKEELQQNYIKHISRKMIANTIKRQRSFEIQFRREFY